MKYVFSQRVVAWAVPSRSTLPHLVACWSPQGQGEADWSTFGASVSHSKRHHPPSDATTLLAPAGRSASLLPTPGRIRTYVSSPWTRDCWCSGQHRRHPWLTVGVPVLHHLAPCQPTMVPAQCHHQVSAWC